MSKSQHDAKKAAELKAAIAAKPPTPAFFEKPAAPAAEDYVPPPVVDLGLVGPTATGRRRPLPSEVNQDLVREIRATEVEETKLEIGRSTHFGNPPPTAEATEAAHLDNVRQLKVTFAKLQAVGKMPKYDHEDRKAREAKAHADNIAFIKSEMLNTIHTEDYSG